MVDKEKQKKSDDNCNSFYSLSQLSLRFNSDSSCANPFPVQKRVISTLYL